MPTKEEYWRNPEHYRRYSRKYLRNWRANNPGKDYNPKIRPAYQKAYHNRPDQRDKYLARQLLASAIRSGRIIRQPCEIARCKRQSQAHHHDYGKPLEVQWLCIKHHKELHRKIIN